MTEQNLKKLAKFLEYVLGRRPDEFGILLDPQGFCKTKTLLQALHEDSEWRHVRQGQLNSVILMMQPSPIEIHGNLVRACKRDDLPAIEPAPVCPKLLYTAVRQRAHPVVLDKGLRASGLPYVLLWASKEQAQRIGRRVDNAPVILTVRVTAAQTAGVEFKKYGDHLFMTEYIPNEAISAPPLPKERPSTTLATKPQEESVEPSTPGSYFPNLAAGLDTVPKSRKRTEKDWKKDRRQARREKARRGW